MQTASPMIRHGLLAAAIALSAAALSGCGEGSAGSGEGGSGGGSGAGGPGGSFDGPGPHDPPPQVVSAGGPVMQFPRVKAIYFADDPSQNEQLDAFIGKLAASSYWADLSAEYGFGKLAVGASVHRTNKAPDTLNEMTLLSELKLGLQSGSSTWGPPSSSTIYMFVIPAGTNFLAAGLCCTNFAGYHDETLVGSTKIAYAVACDCPDAFPGVSELDQITMAVAHELLEAASNPFVRTAPAFQQTDPDHAVWTYLTVGEIADLCQFEKNVLIQPTDIGFGVPRIWSNREALAGHDPCVPAPSEPYFNSVPVLRDKITMHFYNKDWPTLGVAIPEGGQRTIDVQLFSDGPTGDWTVSALGSASGQLGFAWDKDTGNNGDTLKLTISVLKAAPGNQGEAFYLFSKKDGRSHMWMGAVGR